MMQCNKGIESNGMMCLVCVQRRKWRQGGLRPIPAHLLAEVRLRPRPPALVLIRNTKVLLSTLLKSSTLA